MGWFQLKSRLKFDVRRTSLEGEVSRRRGAGREEDLIPFRFNSPRGKPLFRLIRTAKRAEATPDENEIRNAKRGRKKEGARESRNARREA